MKIEMFSEYPDFPFSEYYKSPNQYVSAQKYWLYVLRQTTGFVESEWCAVIRPIDIEQDLIDGLMLWIRKSDLKKEIILHTNSFGGAVNQYQKDNTGMSERDVKEAKEIFSYNPPEAIIRGVTWDEAKAEVETYYEAFIAGVEKTTLFQYDPSHSEQGYEVSSERLVVTSEISSNSEPKAIQALELFVQPGSAMERVNSVFAPDEEY